jgi:LmbE family N-acetylglucosaminyl deacetylase
VYLLPLFNLLWSDPNLNLDALTVPPDLLVVVLAPHPDDFDAIAVTMRFFHKNGNQIEVAVVSSGASGVEDGFGGAFSAFEKAALREEEQRASCRHFGLSGDRLTFLRLAEDSGGDPEESDANQELVSSYLATQQPDIVFLPHHNDPNLGHQRTYNFLRRAVEAQHLAMMACMNRDPKTIAMRNDLYLGFGAELAAWKGELLRAHQSQHQRNLHQRGYGFDQRILSLNRQTAAALGIESESAEAFEVEKIGCSFLAF